jgi:hypothetical protein
MLAGVEEAILAPNVLQQRVAQGRVAPAASRLKELTERGRHSRNCGAQRSGENLKLKAAIDIDEISYRHHRFHAESRRKAYYQLFNQRRAAMGLVWHTRCGTMLAERSLRANYRSAKTDGRNCAQIPAPLKHAATVHIQNVNDM